jgi:hypothetical protein
VRDVVFEGGFISFCATGASPAALAISPRLENVSIRSMAVGFGSCGAVFQNYGSASVRGTIITGPESGQQPDCGIKLVNGDTAFISDTNVTLAGRGLLISPGAGQNVYATYVSNSLFDNGRLISGGFQADSCSILPTGTGNVIETSLSNVWCGLAGENGLLANHSGTGVIDGLHIQNLIADGNGANGVHIAAGVRNWSSIGGQASANVLNGYHVSAASVDFAISFVRAGCVSQRGCNGQIGIKIGAAASDRYSVVYNNTTGSVVGGLVDDGTGSKKNVERNF